MEVNYTGINYADIKYSTTIINRNFKIKVKGSRNGQPIERIVGVSGLIDEVSDTGLVNTLLERAFKSKTDKIVCKLRRGLQIIFYRH